MLTKTRNNFKKIVSLLLAVCMITIALTQTATAASAGTKLDEAVTKIVDKQVKSKDSAKKKLKKLFTYVQK